MNSELEMILDRFHALKECISAKDKSMEHIEKGIYDLKYENKKKLVEKKQRETEILSLQSEISALKLSISSTSSNCETLETKLRKEKRTNVLLSVKLDHERTLVQKIHLELNQLHNINSEFRKQNQSKEIHI